jgi:uncharacterized protein (TIGR00730 family)
MADRPWNGDGSMERTFDRNTDTAVPAPAHPKERREPLPWHRPKPGSEDPDAPARIKAILDSPGYRQADQDVAFLGLDETRGVRLQLDYQKAELALEKQGVQHTIVVFGSTRICEPQVARSRVESLRGQIEQRPDDEDLRRRLATALRIMAKSRYYDVAREFGQLVGRAGSGPSDGRLLLMTGGGPGVMEAANRGAYDVGGRSIGLNISLPHEQYPNPYVTPDLCFRFRYFALRKLHFLLRTKALVAFPGGYGTLDELFETLTLIQTRKIRPVPVVLVGEHYWRRVIDMDFLVEEGVIDEEDRDLFWYAESAGQIWDGILRWHSRNGTPLFPGPVRHDD